MILFLLYSYLLYKESMDSEVK